MALHEFAGGEMLPDGSALLRCSCKARFQGPPEEAAEGYRLHMSEPVFPSEGGGS